MQLGEGWGWVELSPGEGHRLALGVLNGLYPPVATTLPTLGTQGGSHGHPALQLGAAASCRVNKSARFGDTELCVGITGSSPVEPASFTPNRTTFF